MKINKDGTYDRDLEHAIHMVKLWEKTVNALIKIGWCYNDFILSSAHNERAYWINKIEQDSNYILLCKVWNDGSVHVYDRKKYLKHSGLLKKGGSK